MNKKIRLGYSEKIVPVYPEDTILDAIKDEGLADEAWGYKTPTCIWVYVDGQEKDSVWRGIKPSLTGVEVAFYDNSKLEEVNYYIIETE